MLFEQDPPSYDTVHQQNPGTMCQIPRQLLAIAFPFLPIENSVQREYKKIYQNMIEQLHRTTIFFGSRDFQIGTVLLFSFLNAHEFFLLR